MKDILLQGIPSENFEENSSDKIKYEDFIEVENIGSIFQINLADLSNRRLKVRNFYPKDKNGCLEGTDEVPVKLSWSVDRITVIGKVRRGDIFMGDVRTGEFAYSEKPFDQLLDSLIKTGYVSKAGRGWTISDEYGENLAYIERVQFDEEKGRIDFNPNKLTEYLTVSLKTFIEAFLDKSHFSRVDVACDIIGAPNEYIRQYKVISPVSEKVYLDRSKRVETVYFGSRSSNKQVRMYNKMKEQSVKKKVLPVDWKTWWRLELQLRGKRIEDWELEIRDTLANFASPNHMPEGLSVNERIYLEMLFMKPEYWAEISKPTKAKYKALMKVIASEDELSKLMFETFLEQRDRLKSELENWLFGHEIIQNEGLIEDWKGTEIYD